MSETAASKRNGWHGAKWIRRDKRLSLWARDGFRCVYCARRAGRVELTLDHIVARECGGSNHETNLVTACRRCNEAKSVTPVEQFVRARFPKRACEVMSHVVAIQEGTMTLDRALGKRLVAEGAVTRVRSAWGGWMTELDRTAMSRAKNRHER